MFNELEALKAFRAILVEGRREIVRTAHDLREANRQGGSYGKNWGADFQQIQEQIEAIDRAIKDEESLEPHEPTVFSV